MKTVLGIAVVGFFVALAVIVGYRMSAEAMAVVVGVVCGVVASIPISGLILLVTQRARRQERTSVPHPRWESYYDAPPVVIVQGGNPNQGYPSLPAHGGAAMMAMPRDFRVVGGGLRNEGKEVGYENWTAMV